MLNGSYSLRDHIRIAFTDSGAPPNLDNYTMLIILHGGRYAAELFPLHVANTSDPVPTPNSSYKDFMMAVLATFTRTFVEKEKIPRSGGMANWQPYDDVVVHQPCCDKTRDKIILEGIPQGYRSIRKHTSSP
ncbi:hypothetical protein VNI00_008815 [Paramarasmius palmivorus]|uniref:Uncharacterized protein n=1 Tax=Paramarasmius palmivorus TaxID=297713 RepID=A0AAW0CSG9_9AGAR